MPDPVLVWNASLAASPFAGALVAWWRARHAVRAPRPEAPVRTSLEGLGEGAPCSLVGRLGATRPGATPSLLALSARDRDGRVWHVADGDLALTLDDGTALPIEGEVRVLSGAREAPPWNALGDDQSAALARIALRAGRALDARSLTVVRAVGRDDRVTVRARLVARPDPDAAAGAYRDTALRYALAPEPDAVFVYAANPPKPPSKVVPVLRGAALGFLVVTALLLFVGAAASGLVHAGRRALDRDGARVVWRSTVRETAARVAGVSPFERRRMWLAIAEVRRFQARPTEADLREAHEALRRVGACDEALSLAVERQWFDDVRDDLAWRECTSPQPPAWLASQGWYVLGEFARASAALSPQNTPFSDLYASYLDHPAFDVRAHLLAGDEGLAARIAGLRARYILQRRAPTDDDRRRADTLACIADRHGAAQGDARAFERLAEAARTGHAADACALLLADARAVRDGSLRGAVQTLRTHGRATAAPCGANWSQLVDAPAALLGAMLPAYDAARAARHPSFTTAAERGADVDARCNRAAFAALVGDDDTADRHLAEVADALSTDDAPWVASSRAGLDGLRAAIARLRGGATLRAHGDDAALSAALFETEHTALPPWIVTAAPSTERFDGPARWLRTVAPTPCAMCRATTRVAQLAQWRRASRAAGLGDDPATAAVLSRLSHALLREETAVSIAVLDAMANDGAR